jgi:hypothetical protein
VLAEGCCLAYQCSTGTSAEVVNVKEGLGVDEETGRRLAPSPLVGDRRIADVALELANDQPKSPSLRSAGSDRAHPDGGRLDALLMGR